MRGPGGCLLFSLRPFPHLKRKHVPQSMNTSQGQHARAAPRTVARAVVIKEGDVFFLAEHSGEVPAANQDGFGLYYHDCRFLNGYELRLAGTTPIALVCSAERGSIAHFELTNETLQRNGGTEVAQQTFGISLQRVINSRDLAVHDVFTFENYDVQEHTLPVSFYFQYAFEDVFEIRGLHPKKVGKEIKPEWSDGVLILSYAGADRISRRLEVHFDPKSQKATASGAEFILKLGAGERRKIQLTLCIIESREQQGSPAALRSDPVRVANAIDRRSQEWLAQCTEVETDSTLLNMVMTRSLLDLGILKSSLDNREFFSAGLPWYGALFGRDSIIAALQMLAYQPQIAEQTIRLLAKYQGSKTDDWRDEEPGKILHELRRGELANLNEIPQTPYYGSVDSTPLFLILVGEHANWTGDLNLFRDIKINIEKALHWIDNCCHEANSRYLFYSRKSSRGLGNQGWKDSGDSIMNADGSLAEPPIALVEVQGYVYRAKLLIADLYGRAGEDGTAVRLRHEAEDLKSQFNRDFWMDEKQFYAIALQKENRPAAVVSSNSGQALWTGIIEDSRAAAVVRQLISEDMFSGWGIRTLSLKERRFNPIGYHLGTVWPHDNSIIAAGFRRYGFDGEAVNVLNGIVKAAEDFEHHRLPEVFAGFSQNQFSLPVRYPVACHPQAWAAGSIPFMVSSLLGLSADAFNGRLRVIRPVLPTSVSDLELRQLKIGECALDLRFHRTRNGSVTVKVVNRVGNIEVEVEAGLQSEAA
jgi:glycogen debranching enzyme